VGSLVRSVQRPQALPGPWVEQELPPRNDDLVRAYVRHVGGEPSLYRARLPPHFVPQWGFELVERVLAQAGHPLTRVINAGFRMESHEPLASGETLFVKARLESVDDDGRRVKMVARLVTGTRQAPEALTAEWRTYVPLARKEDGEKNGNQHPPPPGEGRGGGAEAKSRSDGRAASSVPMSAREIAYFRLKKDAGLDFAKLTGDVNPIHWVPVLARAAGFRSCILHGFSTFARAYEAIVRNVYAGDVDAVRAMEGRFTRPLVLPAQVGVYVVAPAGLAGAGGGQVYVGDAPGGGAYLEGQFETRAAGATTEDGAWR